MTAPNGREIIRIGRKGKRLFAIGDGEPVELDVVVVQQQWSDVRRVYEGDDRKVPPENFADCNQAAFAFVQGLFPDVQDLSGAEAGEFLALVNEEVQKLQVFFKGRSPDGRSSPEPTTVTFSE